MHPAIDTSRQWWRDWERELGDAPGFAETQISTYSWPHPYTTEAYIQLLGTHSDHIVLDEPVRRALFEAVAAVIAGHGDLLELEYVTTLALGRRTGSR